MVCLFVLAPNKEVNPDARKIATGVGLFPDHPVKADLESKVKEAWRACKGLFILQCSLESIPWPKLANLHFIKNFLLFSLFHQL